MWPEILKPTRIHIQVLKGGNAELSTHEPGQKLFWESDDPKSSHIFVIYHKNIGCVGKCIIKSLARKKGNI